MNKTQNVDNVDRYHMLSVQSSGSVLYKGQNIKQSRSTMEIYNQQYGNYTSNQLKTKLQERNCINV